MSGTVQKSEGAGGPQAPDDTERFSSLLASGERVLLVRRRHWFTFVDAGRGRGGRLVDQPPRRHV